MHLVLALRKEATVGTFDKGLYSAATYHPANPGRVGRSIILRAGVIHTTDMMPNTWNAWLKAWSQTVGGGDCAHFGIGPTPTQGLVQFVPVNRNANHAGGTPHGWYVTADGSMLHPNSAAFGVELHNAGLLHWLSKDRAVFKEAGKTLGEFRLGAGEIYVDDLGRPWHRVTDYQLETLETLLRDIRPLLSPLQAAPKPDAALVKDRTKWDMSYAAPVCTTLVGHASLDPVNRMDPGPQVMAFINNIATREHWA